MAHTEEEKKKLLNRVRRIKGQEKALDLADDLVTGLRAYLKRGSMQLECRVDIT